MLYLLSFDADIFSFDWFCCICVFVSISKSKISSICYWKNVEKKNWNCVEWEKPSKNKMIAIILKCFEIRRTKDPFETMIAKSKEVYVFSYIFVRLQFFFSLFLVNPIGYNVLWKQYPIECIRWWNHMKCSEHERVK